MDHTEKRTNTALFYWLIAFAAVFLLSLLYARRANITEQYYDARNYWNIAGFVFESKFDLINILKFPESMRGYFFPLLLEIFKYFFHGITGWRVLAAVTLAFCFSLSLPFAIGRKAIDSIGGLIRTLLCFIVFLWVWGDLMQYPLSDFISCFFLLSSIAFFRQASPEKKPALRILFGLSGGALLYAAYNTRTTFLYSAVIVLLAYIILNRRSPRTILLVIPAAVLGMAVIASPQCYINNHNLGSPSPLVDYKLTDSEVFRGIYTARYETYIGDPELYPTPGVVFRDPAGTEIVHREHLTKDNFRLSQIFSLFLKYPLDMTGIYLRHLISLMTPVYRQVYITDIYAADPLLAVISILFWLIAAFGILMQIRLNGISGNALWILAVCVPGLLQVFDEPEVRFFLPVYLLCYYYIFVIMDHKAAVRALKANRLQTLVLFAVIFVFWISAVSGTLTGSREKTLLLSENTIYQTDK